MLYVGVENSEAMWFRNYLDNKELCVRVNNEDSDYSDYLNVTCGVPQGRISSPLLFYHMHKLSSKLSKHL